MKYLILLLWLAIGGGTALRAQTTSVPTEDSLQCLTPTEFDFYAKALVECQAGRITIHDLKEMLALCRDNVQSAEQLLAIKITEFEACNAKYKAEKSRADKQAGKVRFWRNVSVVAVCVAVIEALIGVLTLGH